MSFSVFSCRTIINSLRREEGGERKNCEILTGRILLACLESRFSSQGTVKPPRSWSLGLQRCRHHGGGCWMATLRARMSFANRNRSPPICWKEEGWQPLCSCSKSSSPRQPPPLEVEAAVSRVAPRVATTSRCPPSRRSIGKAVSVSHTAPLL